MRLDPSPSLIILRNPRSLVNIVLPHVLTGFKRVDYSGWVPQVMPKDHFLRREGGSAINANLSWSTTFPCVLNSCERKSTYDWTRILVVNLILILHSVNPSSNRLRDSKRLQTLGRYSFDEKRLDIHFNSLITGLPPLFHLIFCSRRPLLPYYRLDISPQCIAKKYLIDRRGVLDSKRYN